MLLSKSFLLRLYVPVNIFSVMSGRSQRFLGLTSKELMCLAQGHNTVALVGIEPRTSRFGVRRPTTAPPRSLKNNFLTSLISTTCAYLFSTCDFTKRLTEPLRHEVIYGTCVRARACVCVCARVKNIVIMF